MANITLLGASYEDVPAVELPQTGGGVATFYDMSSPYSWMGINAEHVSTLYTASLTLADTTYPSWTPSTTAKTIKATANADTFVADMSEYEYLLRWTFDFTAAYAEGTTLKAAPVRECIVLHQEICRRPNGLANIAADNWNSNACLTLFTAPLLEYYNTSGALTYTYASSYGVYLGATAATFSSSTSNTPTVTIKTPTINARCNSTYFSTTMAADIDPDNSTIKVVGDLFRYKKGGSMRSMYQELVDVYNNPL